MQKMSPFLDSTPLMGDGDALRERLDCDGYLFVRELLPRKDVIRVQRRLLQKASKGGWLDPTTSFEEGIANNKAACKDPEEAYMKVFPALWNDEELHRLRTHSRILEFFDLIFGEATLAHPTFVQRNIFPRRADFDFTTQPHQDKPNIGGDTNYALWSPLGDCPIEKGSLAVSAGSHKYGVLDIKVSSGAGGMEIAVPIPGKWVTGPFSAGDVLIFSDETVHKAMPNQTTELRQSFDARYQPASHTICENQLVPYPGCGSWNKVYEGWRHKDQQYYWEKFSLKTAPLDRSVYEARDQMAFKMAENGEVECRDTLLRIVQRDKNSEKVKKAQALLLKLNVASGTNGDSLSLPTATTQ